MAITKIWAIGASEKGLRSSYLKNTLTYIVNGEKTEECKYVGSINCMPDADMAYEQMLETKRIHGKELGRQGYHIKEKYIVNHDQVKYIH